ncbi:serine/threonine-protein kinase PknB [Limnoglobus roseus]|uniref:Serine/threonine-protein kinase PknB n=2 Tax=Limnoglobus roseus TaxID=2598579 RepID=A0A5C1A7A9_9BACT|nr:serine/threonine-protein kinase PknB [Limnoglobus roseus]
MGVVYEVTDPLLGCSRAMKMMLDAFARRPGAKERFLAEAKVMAALGNHPNVVMVLEYGEYDGQPYLVMPLLQGRSLEAALRTAVPPALGEVLQVAEHVARGLSAVHARKLVHRDIKPANIWLEENPDGSPGQVKLMDFGIARDEPGEGEAVTQETGTAGYMSLEQLRGLEVGPRTDLFSLGVVLYRMLAHQMPYSVRSWPDYMESLTNHTPTPLHTLNPAVPKALSDLVDRMIARATDVRPDSAKAVADQFAAIAAGRVGPAQPQVVDSSPWWQDQQPAPSADPPAPSTQGKAKPTQRAPEPPVAPPPPVAVVRPPVAKPVKDEKVPAWLTDSRENKARGSDVHKVRPLPPGTGTMKPLPPYVPLRKPGSDRDARPVSPWYARIPQTWLLIGVAAIVGGCVILIAFLLTRG